jgi:hypothetical protein
VNVAFGFLLHGFVKEFFDVGFYGFLVARGEFGSGIFDARGFVVATDELFGDLGNGLAM